MIAAAVRLRKGWARLRQDRRGMALTEFAFAAPILMTLGLFGLESANLALAHMRVSQIAANLADTTSRIGEASALSLKRIRESDINDAFEAVRIQSGAYAITTHGRVILSSLEQNSAGGQWIHWQRCVGMKDFDSSYGDQGTGATGTAFPGMGEAGREIQAPAGLSVMFVEVAYDYQPLIADVWEDNRVIHAQAAFLVRDRRDLTDPNNPTNPAPSATASTCDRHTV